jgi:hypothetical protein
MADALATTSQSVFDSTFTPTEALITAQMSPSAPAITQIQNGTDLLVSDHTIASRLSHFPEDLYDLRTESHLVRFLSSLLGDSGAGQLRKRYLLARIQSNLDSSNFFDLDGFYGAIFGANRRPEDVLPVNPYTDVETPDAWDQIMATDTRYRERITALAAAIPMAATLPGIRQAAEAVVGVECDVYEVWRFIDAGTNLLSGVATWSSVMGLHSSWLSMQGFLWPQTYSVGNLAVTTAAEVVIRPKKVYNITTPDGAREKTLDELGLSRVLSVLKPAGVVITVDTHGLSMHSSPPIASTQSDSNYWEVSSQVRPSPVLSQTPGLYPLSASQVAAGILWGDQRTLPQPPLVTSHGLSWEQASAVVKVTATAMTFENDDDITQPGSGIGTIVDPLNFQYVPYYDGTRVAYSAERGASDPGTVRGGLAVASGTLAAAPFSGTRETVPGR